MGNTGKTFALLLTLIIAVPCLTLPIIKPANAQTIPKPSAPEFTAILVDHSYDTPSTTPTYTTDPYTGEQTQVSSGSPSYHVQNKSIEITIKNQPFTPYNDSEGRYIGLYYNFRFKGHFGSDWTYDPFMPNGVSSQRYGGWDMTYLIPYTPSNSQYTIVNFPLGKSGISNYGQEDFQVQAQIGYILMNGNSFMQRVYGVNYNFTGESSDWSPIQTVTITETPSQTSTLPPTPTPSVPELSWLIILPLLLSLFTVAVILRHRKTVNTNQWTIFYASTKGFNLCLFRCLRCSCLGWCRRDCHCLVLF